MSGAGSALAHTRQLAAACAAGCGAAEVKVKPLAVELKAVQARRGVPTQVSQLVIPGPGSAIDQIRDDKQGGLGIVAKQHRHQLLQLIGKAVIQGETQAASQGIPARATNSSTEINR